jgi:hypothetical protein
VRPREEGPLERAVRHKAEEGEVKEEETELPEMELALTGLESAHSILLRPVDLVRSALRSIDSAVLTWENWTQTTKSAQELFSEAIVDKHRVHLKANMFHVEAVPAAVYFQVRMRQCSAP